MKRKQGGRTQRRIFFPSIGRMHRVRPSRENAETFHNNRISSQQNATASCGEFKKKVFSSVLVTHELSAVRAGNKNSENLTLITCYPFMRTRWPKKAPSQ